jgi:hypothetical protein
MNCAFTVEKEVDGFVAAPVDEQGRVRLGLDEADGSQVGGEATVPGSRRLLETVHGAVQSADQIRTSGVDEASGLSAVDSLRQSAISQKTPIWRHTNIYYNKKIKC